MTTKLDKALAANVLRIPGTFRHSPTPNRPDSSLPSTAGLTDPTELALFNKWWSQRSDGILDPIFETAVNAVPNVLALTKVYENFLATDAGWIAWAQADYVSREMQFRYQMVRAGLAVHRLGTVPISSDPAGVGTPAPAIRDIVDIAPSNTVTISIASPAVVTWAAHGLAVGRPIQFATTGALPTGLATNTVYYVSNVIDANTFRVSATLGGSDINTTGSQSGTHTIIIVNSTPSLFAGGDISNGLSKDIYQVPAGTDLKITDIVVTSLAPTAGYFPSLYLDAYSKASQVGIKISLLWLPLPNHAPDGFTQVINLQSPAIVPAGFFLAARFLVESGPATGTRGSVSIPGFYFD